MSATQADSSPELPSMTDADIRPQPAPAATAGPVLSSTPTIGREGSEAPQAQPLAGIPTFRRENSDPPQTRTRPTPRLCGICNTQAAKYKCPRCTMSYCSVACNRTHKENHPPTLEPAPQVKPPPPTDNESESPFDVLLDHRDDFDRLFNRYPFLQSALLRVLERTHPPKEDPGIRTSSLFVKQGPSKRKYPWTKAEGLRQGAEALRKARTDPSDTGDGVREFCGLVLHLLSTSSKRGGAGDGIKIESATGMVHEEIVAEETDVIRQLMKEEGYSP